MYDGEVIWGVAVWTGWTIGWFIGEGFAPAPPVGSRVHWIPRGKEGW